MRSRDPKEVLSIFDSIQGMMGRLSAAAFIYFLERQEKEDIRGDLIEFGVYKGKSASILANYTRQTERLILVDVARYPEADQIRDLADNVVTVTCRSEEFQKSFDGFKSLVGRLRMVHVDGSHRFNNVVNELENLRPSCLHPKVS